MTDCISNALPCVHLHVTEDWTHCLYEAAGSCEILHADSTISDSMTSMMMSNVNGVSNVTNFVPVASVIVKLSFLNIPNCSCITRTVC